MTWLLCRLEDTKVHYPPPSQVVESRICKVNGHLAKSIRLRRRRALFRLFASVDSSPLRQQTVVAKLTISGAAPRQHPSGGIDFRGANLLCAKAGEGDYVPYFSSAGPGPS